MCISLIAIKYHSNYPLIIISNRDEYHSRLTKSAHFWDEYPGLLAGKDLEAGGTWFGINKSGNIALLTNVRTSNKKDTNKKSRGLLVVDYLKGNISQDEYLLYLTSTQDMYNGYNIIFGNYKILYYYNNIKNISKILTKGIYIISNGTLNEMWPKCKRLKELFLTTVSPTSKSVDKETLFEILKDTTQFPDQLLPDTGVGLKKERFLSPIFIKDYTYGTRTSTVLLVDKFKNITFIEKNYIPGTDTVKEQKNFSFIAYNNT